jgi:hypothetical protein
VAVCNARLIATPPITFNPAIVALGATPTPPSLFAEAAATPVTNTIVFKT